MFDEFAAPSAPHQPIDVYLGDYSLSARETTADHLDYRRPPMPVNRPESVPQVMISPEDTEAFQRLVRYVNQHGLVMSFEEATSQRVSNELVSEQGAVQ
jgi:hypothetical protein